MNLVDHCCVSPPPHVQHRLAPCVPSNTLLSKWSPLARTEGPAEDEGMVAQFRSAVHLVDLALMQAAPSVQLVRLLGGAGCVGLLRMYAVVWMGVLCLTCTEPCYDLHRALL